jgi:hypothetical protein
MKIKSLAIFSSIVISGLPAPVSAALFTYTETGVVSGSLNGVSFTDSLITITGSGDTSQITSDASGFFLALPLAFTLSGVGSGTFTDSMIVASNQDDHLAGFGDATQNRALLFTTNDAFATYDLSTAIGPESGLAEYNHDFAFATSAGGLITRTFSGDATFTAFAGAVPESSTWAMMLIGFAGLSFAGYRRIRRPA